MSTIIAKNITNHSIMIEDLGIHIPEFSTIELTGTCDLSDITESMDLMRYVENGQVVINNGNHDLVKTNGLKQIQVKTALEDETDKHWHVWPFSTHKSILRRCMVQHES